MTTYSRMKPKTTLFKMHQVVPSGAKPLYKAFITQGIEAYAK